MAQDNERLESANVCYIFRAGQPVTYIAYGSSLHGEE